MISATPALSSAPSSVVPSVAMSVCSLEERKLRKFGHGHRHGIVQPDIPAVVMFDNLRLHILAAHVGTRIHMGYEPYHRPVLITRRRRNRPHNIAVTVHLHLLQAERLHLLGQTGEQHFLLLGRRESRTVLVALRIEADVFQESFKQFHMHLFGYTVFLDAAYSCGNPTARIRRRPYANLRIYSETSGLARLESHTT